MPIKTKRFLAAAGRLFLLLLLAVFFIIPIYLILVNSFKPSDIVMSTPMSVSLPPTFENIIKVITNKGNNVFAMYGNSLLLVVLIVPLSLAINSLAAYYLARSATKLSRFLRVYFLAGLMVPYVIVYIPVSLVARFLHIPLGIPLLVLIFLSATVPFSTFMYTNFIRGVPIELEEAAAIDGAGRLYTFCKIILPMLKPCTATVIIFNGLGVWNDFMTPLLMGQVKTVTVGIYTAIGPHSANYGLIFGYLLFAIVPVIIIYLLLQKQFVAGLTAGATKG